MKQSIKQTMPKAKKLKRRIFPNSTIKEVQTLVRIVGYDGAWIAFNQLEEGKSAEEVMRSLRPYFDRYVKAHGEERNTRRDFYRSLTQKGGAK